MKATTEQIVTTADQARQAGRWEEALRLYCSLPNHKNNSALLQNQAVCYFGLRQFDQAAYCSAQALRLLASMWQAALIYAKSMRELGKVESWAKMILQLVKQLPNNADIAMEYASVLMVKNCDAAAVIKLVERYLDHPLYAEKARHMRLMNMLYDRPAEFTAQQHFAETLKFAERYLSISDSERLAQAEPIKLVLNELSRNGLHHKGSRKRVGFISGLFTASPVYFLSIDVLRRLANDGHELVFFSRKPKIDWATRQFKALAAHWIDCSQMSPPMLEAALKFCQVDELFDMAGWTDTDVLKALASKPAALQFKWVGGQSCSTGMHCFDGYITDDRQTPPNTFSLYSESLISLGKHYVNYTPPPYMPLPRPRVKGMTINKLIKRGEGLLGVAANPIKISGVFLEALAEQMRYILKKSEKFKLRFIDKRLSDDEIRDRITNALKLPNGCVEFVTPKDHPAFLDQLSETDLIFDTFPYSGGLTVCEAKYLQVPVHLFAYDRRLFSERHSISHLER